MNEDCVIGIVDDDASLRRSLANLLRSAGFAIETFASAEDFLQTGKAEAMDVLVLDLRMPGMSGVDLLADLGRRAVQLPVVILTAHGDEDMRKQCLRAGALAFLTKPFAAKELLAAVRQAAARD